MSEAENPYRAPKTAEYQVPAWKWAMALLLYVGSIPFGLVSAVSIVAAFRWWMFSGIRHLFIGLLLSTIFGAIAWGLIRLANRLRRGWPKGPPQS